MAFGIGGSTIGASVVELFLKDSGFDRGLTQAEAKLQGFNKAAAGGMTGFQRAARGAFLVAGAAAVAFAAIAVKAYAEHQAVVSRLQATINKMPKLAGESTRAFEDQATALQNLTGYEDEQILAADTILARFNLTGQEIRQVIPTVLDYARATGKDVPVAAELVGKALLGNTRALKAVGISYKTTGIAAKDYENILRLLQSRVGGTAEAFGKTYEGRLEIFKARLSDIAEEAGRVLLPELTRLLGGFEHLMPVLSFAAGHLTDVLLALLAWKAASFIPALLGGIAKGMGAVAIATKSNALLNAAAGIQNLVAGLKGLGGSILPAIAIWAIFISAIRAWDARKHSLDIAEFRSSIQPLQQQFKQGAISAEHFAQRLGYYSDSLFRSTNDTEGFRNALVQLVPAIAAGRVSQETYNDLLFTARRLHIDLPAMVKGYSASLKGSALSADEAAAAAQELATEQERAAVAALELKTVEDQLKLTLLGLAGGFLGIEGAVLSAEQAQQQYRDAAAQVAKDIRNGKQGTADYRQHVLALRQASLGAVQAQLSLREAVAKFTRDAVKNQVPLSSIIQQVISFGHAAGVSKKQVVGMVVDILEQFGNVPRRILVKFGLVGGEKGKADLKGLIDWAKKVKPKAETRVGAPGARGARSDIEATSKSAGNVPKKKDIKFSTPGLQNAWRDVGALNVRLGRLKTKHSITFSTPGLQNAWRDVGSLHTRIARLPSRKDIYVVTHFSSTGTPARGYQHGGTVGPMGAVARVGEAGPEMLYIPPRGHVFTAAQTGRIERALMGSPSPAVRTPPALGTPPVAMTRVIERAVGVGPAVEIHGERSERVELISGRIRIDDWKAGTGYFEGMIRRAFDSDRRHKRQLAKMHRGSQPHSYDL